jgi:hypothetical protein
MATTTKPDERPEAAQTGIRGPRRAAMQGLAGLVALGAAFLGSERAAAKNPWKHGNGAGGATPPPSGVLLRIQTVINLEGFAEPGQIASVDAMCPAPGKNEVVFVLGGGFSAVEDDLRLLDGAAGEESNAPVYTVSVQNTSTTKSHNFGSQAICGYFRK